MKISIIIVFKLPTRKELVHRVEIDSIDLIEIKIDLLQTSKTDV